MTANPGLKPRTPPPAQALASVSTFLISRTQCLLWTGQWEVVNAQSGAGLLLGPPALTGGCTLNSGRPAQECAKAQSRPEKERESWYK